MELSGVSSVNQLMKRCGKMDADMGPGLRMRQYRPGSRSSQWPGHQHHHQMQDVWTLPPISGDKEIKTVL